MEKSIYMDNHATTPMDPKVLEAMLPYFCETFGNASSKNHSFGWEADEAVKSSRQLIAKSIGAKELEFVFTSGATESNNLAITGVARMYKEKGNHIITVITEHKAVLDTCDALTHEGFEITYLGVDKDGMISLDELKNSITDKTILVSVMHANNEIGVIQPIKEVGAICKDKGILFHTDATQAIGKIKIDVDDMNIDLLSMSAHKIYGPKGIGGLYVRRRKPRVRLTPLIHGGGHERGMRSGTLNVPSIVGFAKAIELANNEMSQENQRLSTLRDKLEKALMDAIDYTQVNGKKDSRLPGNLNISFHYVEGEGLMMAMPQIAVSSGSACTSSSLEPSYVLQAMGIPDVLCHSSIRFGLGRFTTAEEIDLVIEKVISSVKRLRDLSPLYEMVLEGIDLDTVAWTEH
ncbi:MAG: IscS subfamily cysteine desulfurase [Candidatus Cloacimonadota bacterium]|nr:MAG: IscS subfamily cysteine desulfurase [Candidatus Cloacimonadota bacterium]PCJ20129.1 MAG: IscS subfamily cysteine desulfurase [Candidatus Cloacimonadota bacterium]